MWSAFYASEARSQHGGVGVGGWRQLSSSQHLCPGPRRPDRGGFSYKSNARPFRVPESVSVGMLFMLAARTKMPPESGLNMMDVPFFLPLQSKHRRFWMWSH